MSNLDQALTTARTAIADLIAASERCGSRWAVAPAPGKWSPSQVVEHVARAMEQSAIVAEGGQSKFPKLPRLMRPVARGLLFNRVVKKGGFPKAKTSKPFNPDRGPATPAEARTRLEDVLSRFDAACRARASVHEWVSTSTFGTVSVADYAQFQAIHVRHHCAQM